MACPCLSGGQVTVTVKGLKQMLLSTCMKTYSDSGLVAGWCSEGYVVNIFLGPLFQLTGRGLGCWALGFSLGFEF